MMKLEAITAGSRFLPQVEHLALEAFPPEEYLPPKKLIDMAAEENFDFWALTEDDRFVGFMVVKIYRRMAYLFFLAIDPGCRGQGFGGKALAALRKHYPGHVQTVDFEMVDPHAANAAQRERRRAFYLRNGYRETGLFLRYLGVDYEVFCMGETFDEMLFRDMMDSMKQSIDGFDPVYRSGNA